MGGAGNNDGPVATAHFGAPYSVATDTSGNVYVADSGNNTIRKITPAGIVSTLAGTPGVQGSADGSGPAASFYYPTGVATDTSAKRLMLADSGNNTIRKDHACRDSPARWLEHRELQAPTPDEASRSGVLAIPSGIATDSDSKYPAGAEIAWNSTIRGITSDGVRHHAGRYTGYFRQRRWNLCSSELL